MTVSVPSAGTAEQLCASLIAVDFGPCFGTPCGILAPLYTELEREADLMTVSREDNAVAVAAGAALSGSRPVVLMQNSGLAQSVNALASLVIPYGIAMLLVVSMRGTDLDDTPENAVMGRLTETILNGLGIEAIHLPPDPAAIAARVQYARDVVGRQHRTAALMVAPSLFGWSA